MIFKRKKGGELMFGIAVASGCQSHDLHPGSVPLCGEAVAAATSAALAAQGLKIARTSAAPAARRSRSFGDPCPSLSAHR